MTQCETIQKPFHDIPAVMFSASRKRVQHNGLKSEKSAILGERNSVLLRWRSVKKNCKTLILSFEVIAQPPHYTYISLFFHL